MTKRRKLEDDEIRAELAHRSGWELADGKLHTELIFADFVEAFGFMTKVAIVAEAKNHHPEWFNVYHRVVIDLWTHDVGGISTWDFELADTIDRLAGRTRTP